MDRRFPKIILFLPVILLVGTIGYWSIENWNFLDSVYMTIITLATIGYHEVHPLSDGGKLFTIFFVIFGVAPAWGFLVSTLFKLMLEGQFLKYLGSRKMIQQIKQLKDHYIVCGYGRVGGTVCTELKKGNMPFVVIERQPELIKEMDAAGFVYVEGRCSDDENLKLAGIERAKALINTIAEEADAVYVTLSARQLNPHLFIMARADSEGVRNKLLRAGATRVLSPHIYAGKHMAQTTMRPTVVDFMNLAAEGASEGLVIEEVAVKKGSRLAGRSLKESGIRSELGITVIGARKQGQKMAYNPPPDFGIDEGDNLILIGSPSQLEKLEEY